MTGTHSKRLFSGAFAICLVVALGLSPGGCNDRTPSNASRDSHEDDGDHRGQDHSEHGRDVRDEDDNDEHNGHEGHDEHADGEDSHEGHDDGGTLRIGPSEQQEFGIDIATAGPAALSLNISLSGVLALNPDNVAHVVPRVAGVTRSVHKSVGDSVREGDLLAVLDSRELAQTKAQYLAALAKERIAKANFAREDKLWKDKISSERAFLAARQALDEAQIARMLAERELHALGLSEDDVHTLTTQPEVEYIHYQLTAPITGTVIERHLVRGEVVKEDADEPTFVIADLGSVWLDLTVYPDDLNHVRRGQDVTVAVPNGLNPLHGKIHYVTPLIDESTRTATARVILPNSDGTLRPGLFVTARLTARTIQVPVAVTNSAIQTIDDKPTVFVVDQHGITPIAVAIGASDESHTEIRDGLASGDDYVAQGGFVLKSELQKSELEHAGHAH